MLLNTTGLLGQLYELELTPTAIKVLSVMVRFQQAGGDVEMKQTDIDAILGVGPSAMSKAMTLLVERGLVLRSAEGRGHSYSLNPAIAGYESEYDLKAEMTKQLAVGGPPPIHVPGYEKMPPKPGSAPGLRSVA
ncbi:hypothetical protein ACWDZ4_20020 [Streptomyces sp. NPDC003016]